MTDTYPNFPKEKWLQDIYLYAYSYTYAYTKTMLALKGGEGSGNFGHAGRPGEVGGSGEGGRSGNKLESIDQLNAAKDKLANQGQGIHSAIINGSELRNGKLLAINGKLYKVTSTTASDKFEVREVTSINVDRLFSTGGNDNFLNLDYSGQYLQVNEKEMVNFFKPLPK